MQEYLIQHGTENVAVAGVGNRDFDSLRDSAAERTGSVGMFGENFLADFGGHGGGGGDLRAVGAHDLAAEGFLLIADLDHKYLQVQSEVRARHGERRAPLTCSGLGGNAL